MQTQLLSADVYVHGATSGGLAAAIRCAREGLSVVLSNPNPTLGGMLANGLTLWDTFYDGGRAVIHDEVKKRIQHYYRDRFGPDSEQYRQACPGPRLLDHQTGAYEPGVVHQVFQEMLRELPSIQVLFNWELQSANVQGRRVQDVLLQPVGDNSSWQNVRVRAQYYVEATVEGDLMAATGCSYRVGREARQEYGEAHAGVLFARKRIAMQTLPDGSRENTSPRDALEGRLNLRTWMAPTLSILPESTGAADQAVQAYNYRLSLSCDPKNQRPVTPPATYDATLYRHVDPNFRIHPIGLVNNKCGWNGARPLGWNFDYPEGDRTTREEIKRRYREYALGLLYFLHTDSSRDPAAREHNRRWALALDEFPLNDNVPYEFYVREGRRLVGRYVLHEADGLLAPGSERTPFHADSVAFTEWPMDSVQCQPLTARDADGIEVPEGAFFLSEESRPAMVPWRSLLPLELDNLAVPVPFSTTHVFWGAARLEPVWLHTGEVCGHAIALSQKCGQSLGDLSPRALQSVLINNGNKLGFFNDLEADSPCFAAFQWLLVHGYCTDYNCREHQELDPQTAESWYLRWHLTSARTQRFEAGTTRGQAALTIWQDALLPD